MNGKPATMRSMSNSNQAQRIGSDRAELAERIDQGTPKDGRFEVRPGVFFNRASVPNETGFVVLEPAFCVIAQGSKDLLLGAERFRYDPAHYLITTMSVPATGIVTTASRQRPYLSLRLTLDPAVVASVLIESASGATHGDLVKSVNVSPIGCELLDATLRLVRLVDRPIEYRVLAPLIIREIVYRLLNGAQAQRLKQIATFGGQAHRMVRAVQNFRLNFDKPLRIQDVADELGMSVSGLHAHFKAVTAMSPLQFQKQLRLQEARRLMLSENLDAGEAGFRVGYEDQSHFSREYKRHFGQPPMRDVERMRETTFAI